MIYLCVLKKR